MTLGLLYETWHSSMCCQFHEIYCTLNDKYVGHPTEALSDRGDMAKPE
ncbi:MAG: hypothetical protein JWP57_2495 [Spirosoma sp.]|nr:hypothetical protein [Spirosoma sp.]